jgi:hypothetical protein
MSRKHPTEDQIQRMIASDPDPPLNLLRLHVRGQGLRVLFQEAAPT